MKNRFYKMTAMLLCVMLLSSLFCLSAGAEDSDPTPFPSQAYMELAGKLVEADNALLPGNDWSDESFAIFKEKYDDAKGVLNDPSSTDEDYIKAAEELQAGLDQLKWYNDKTELWNYIDEVKSSGLLESAAQYTKTTYQKFEDAYTWANVVGIPPRVPQERIDAALADLKTAVAGLILIGDVNNDKEVTVTDVLLVQKNLAELNTLTPEAFDAADADGNGVIEVYDCLQIQKYIAKIIQDFS